MFLFLKLAYNIFKKVLLVVIVYSAVISLFSHFISKDKIALSSNRTDPIKENRKEIYKIINNKELNKTQQGKISIAIYRRMMCSVMGEACTNNPADGDKNFNKSGLGFISNLITLPFSNPPASGIAWTYSGLANAGFFPKALAAEGIGMGSIQPFAKIWKIFRDVTYLLLVIVLIAIGFMVMFRTKINPQTVISVENSLPKIIIALILITFSFAIAGFMIDLMYMLIAIIVSILGPILGGNVVEMQKQYIQAGPYLLYKGIGNNSIWQSVIWELPNSFFGLIPDLGKFVKFIGGLAILHFGYQPITAVENFILSFAGLKTIVESVEPTSGVGAALHLKPLLDGALTFPQVLLTIFITTFIMTSLVPILVGVLIWFSLLFIFFKIFFLLISSYIKILLSVILSPIYILFEAVPGQNAFANWIKNLTGELITFPLVVGIFVMGSVITEGASSGSLVKFPFLVGLDPKSFGVIVGMALLFMTPDLVKAVQSIFIPKPGLLDKASPGVFFGGVGAAVGGSMGAMGQFGSISLGLGALGKIPAVQNLVKSSGLSRILGPFIGNDGKQ